MKMSDPEASPPSENPCLIDNSTSDDGCQLQSPWNTIIVNQIPTNMDDGRLISLFSSYGKIDDTYLCKDPWIRKVHERMSRITYSNEEDALKVWEASQNKLIKYDDHVLAITLACDGYCPIENLPDICLREIFQHVNEIKDKVCLEIVCKRWRDNGRCCWSNITKITQSDGLWPLDIWEAIVPRVQDSLESIFFYLIYEHAEKNLVPVAEHCERLKQLHVEIFPGANYTKCAPFIYTILQKNINLRQLSVFFNNYCYMVLNFMEILPVGLEEIDIRMYSNEVPIPATEKLSRFKNLRILRLHNCPITKHTLIDGVTNLEQLSLIDYDMAESILLTLLRNNKGLKHLRIEMENLHDASLIRISQLPKLQVLVIKSHGFTDAYMGAMSELKGLMCYKCPSITDEGIRILFNSTSEIKELGIVDCSITLEATVIAKEWTERTGKSLKLWVGHEFLNGYLASGGQNTEMFEVVEFDQQPPYRGDSYAKWRLELVE